MTIEVEGMTDDQRKWLRDQDVGEVLIFEKLNSRFTNITCAEEDVDTLTDVLDVLKVEWRVI